MAVARDLGKVCVRQYAGTNAHRTIIDFDADERTLRYLMLSKEGGLLRIGVESVELSWPDLVKLARLIAQTGKLLHKAA